MSEGFKIPCSLKHIMHLLYEIHLGYVKEWWGNQWMAQLSNDEKGEGAIVGSREKRLGNTFIPLATRINY